MGSVNVRTLFAMMACFDPIISCVAPISSITDYLLCVPPPVLYTSCVFSRVVGLLGCVSPIGPLLSVSLPSLAWCVAASVFVADAVWHGSHFLGKAPDWGH